MKNIRVIDGLFLCLQPFDKLFHMNRCMNDRKRKLCQSAEVAWKQSHCLLVNVFSAGFSHLQPLLDGFSLRVTLPNHGICWLLCVANTNNKPIKIPGGLRCWVPARRHRRAIAAPSPAIQMSRDQAASATVTAWHEVENGTCKFSDTLGIAINLFDIGLLLT